jgi:heme exporter protein A
MVLPQDADPVKSPELDDGAIRLDGLARRFGQRWILRGIDLIVQSGEVLALTGRNGSGKTTLLRVLATALRPSRGTARVFGHDVVEEPDAIRALVGLLGHNAALYDDLTAAENLVFAQRMAGGAANGATIERALEAVGLALVARERVRGFSAGMRRRLGLARLLLRPPQLLLLDEPYASFDADGIDAVNEFSLRVAANGGVVVLATHDLARATDVLSRRLHLVDGRLTEVQSGGAAGQSGGVPRGDAVWATKGTGL